MVRSGKGFINSLGFKANARPHKYKKSRYAIRNISEKDLLKIIRDFENFPYESYEKKRLKHDPTDRYFYPAIQLAKCMIVSDALNSHGYPVRPEMIATPLHVCSMDENK